MEGGDSEHTEKVSVTGGVSSFIEWWRALEMARTKGGFTGELPGLREQGQRAHREGVGHTPRL